MPLQLTVLVRPYRRRQGRHSPGVWVRAVLLMEGQLLKLKALQLVRTSHLVLGQLHRPSSSRQCRRQVWMMHGPATEPNKCHRSHQCRKDNKGSRPLQLQTLGCPSLRHCRSRKLSVSAARRTTRFRNSNALQWTIRTRETGLWITVALPIVAGEWCSTMLPH